MTELPSAYSQVFQERLAGAEAALKDLPADEAFEEVAKRQKLHVARSLAGKLVDASIDGDPLDRAIQRATGRLDALARIGRGIPPAGLRQAYARMRLAVPTTIATMRPLYCPEDGERHPFERGYALMTETTPPWVVPGWPPPQDANMTSLRTTDGFDMQHEAEDHLDQAIAGTGDISTHLTAVLRLSSDPTTLATARLLLAQNGIGDRAAHYTEVLALMPSGDLRAAAFIELARLREGEAVALYHEALTAATDPSIVGSAHRGLGEALANREERIHHFLMALAAPDLNTKAVAHLNLALLGDGDKIGHLRDAAALAVNREVTARAHMFLGLAGQDNPELHFIEALRYSRDPELRGQVQGFMQQI